MEKINQGNYFEDFEVGKTIQHAIPRTLTAGDSALYIALTGERYPAYCCMEFAKSLGYKHEVISELNVFHIVYGQSVSDISMHAVANVGYSDVCFLKPVYTGDTLFSESNIIGKKETSSGKFGKILVHTRGYNQNKETVIQFYRWLSVQKKEPEKINQCDEIPSIPSEINYEEIAAKHELSREKFDSSFTGGLWFFEDYEVGERIHHTGARTIEESDHMLAANLYQNSAKAHFNAHTMSNSRYGKRVIYGGYIISLARALSFNGLENITGLLGINSGTHVNVTLAGDTLYVWSDIIDKKELPGIEGFGVLRIGLVALKNVDPTQKEMKLKFKDPEKEKEQYHPNVVLHLDYYALIPKREML